MLVEPNENSTVLFGWWRPHLQRTAYKGVTCALFVLSERDTRSPLIFKPD